MDNQHSPSNQDLSVNMDKKSISDLACPLVPLRDLVIFPSFTVSLFIGREQSKNAVTAALSSDRKIIFVAQKDASLIDPLPEQLYPVGVMAEILQMLRLPDGTFKLLVESLQRVKLDSIMGTELTRYQADYASQHEKLRLKNSPDKEEKNIDDTTMATDQADKRNIISSNLNTSSNSSHASNYQSQRIRVFEEDYLLQEKPSSTFPKMETTNESGVFLVALYNSLVVEQPLSDYTKLRERMLYQLQLFGQKDQHISNEVIKEIAFNQDIEWQVNQIAGRLTLPLQTKQNILEQTNPLERMQKLIETMIIQLSMEDIETKIHKNVNERINKTQKDYYLGEKIKEIRRELGQEEDIYDEARELESKIKAKNLPPDIEEKVIKETKRLGKMPPFSAEITVLRNYIDWFLELPWHEQSKDNHDSQHARDALDQDHYGLEEVKDRILDFIVVRQYAPLGKAPILCLVGPPGVGKTSLARSIARALQRQFVRISLGGVRDEAEIRGHRKTYVGAMPGRIIQSMKKSKTINPLFLLDEIDKLSHDFRGDPASALLEVLDPDQNNSFQDHYLEVTYDLSKVFFIATANTIHTIPMPLRDRMEIISIGSYTDYEKMQIAKTYLLPQALAECGLQPQSIRIKRGQILHIIRRYTKEAGVRSLQRALSKVCRKGLRKIVEEQKVDPSSAVGNLFVDQQLIVDFLGPEKFLHNKIDEEDQVGYCHGLAWTELGGDILGIEVALSPGRGNIQITGNIGDIMKESVYAAMTILKIYGEKMGVKIAEIKRKDVHVHIPEGAIPKDGPSAGITISTALMSAFGNIPVRRNIAMTGEVTLRGKVLPVGGIKEKVLAAYRSKASLVIMPRHNERDYHKLESYVKKRLRFEFVDRIEQVFALALKSAE